MSASLSRSDEVAVRDAMALLQSGDLGGAERAARELLLRMPGNADLRHLLALARLHGGAAPDALGIVEALVREFPGDAFVHNTRAAALQALGRTAEAVDAYRKALECDPAYADAAGNLGMLLLSSRRAEEALALSEEVVARLPQFLPMHMVGGHAAIALGRLDEARRYFESALELSPGQPGILVLLSDVLSRLGLNEQSLPVVEALLEVEPANALAHNNRGTALLALGRTREAEAALRRATSLAPGLARLWHNLGCALLELGRPSECEEAERRSLAIDPQNVEAMVTLSAALNKLNRGEEAEQLSRTALQRDPGNLRAAINLCGALGLQKRHEDALATAVDTARRLAGDPDAHGIAACLLAQGGRYDDALAHYDEAIRLAPAAVHWQALRALAMPIVAESSAQIEACREETMRRVKRLQASDLKLADPARWIGQTGFYLAYQGLENLPLQRAAAQMYLRLHPALGWRAPAASARTRRGRRLKVGFLSAFLHNHTIGKLYQGYIARLDRRRFEVIVFHAEPRQDAIRAAIDASADRVAMLPSQLGEARQAVSDAGLDVLFYPDVGMHNFCYFLAFARLAPVQMTSWGHPDTTGLPHMDYFLSADAIEPADAQSHYSERLVRMKRLPACYARPRLPAATGVRKQLGIRPGARLYACPQSLFKLHPAFDPILGRLLEADPDGILLLVASAHAAWNDALMGRLRRAFPHCANRVQFAPFMPESVFLELLDEADAVIDPVNFGGGNSTYEALGLGVPIVTMPGELMRGRVTLGCYRQMGFEELVARTPGEYVSLAVRLANDATFRGAMRSRVRELSGNLFDDALAVQELEAFMEGAFDEALEQRGAA